jgi:hypothetical protein
MRDIEPRVPRLLPQLIEGASLLVTVLIENALLSREDVLVDERTDACAEIGQLGRVVEADHGRSIRQLVSPAPW